MTTLFISDIHLGTERPGIIQRFCEFLREEASDAEALYILGDLFEVWIGDDAILAEYHVTLEAIKQLTSSGVPVYIMRGNRDFLMGEAFAARCGCRLIDDPTVIDLYGTKTLLMHGDTLCTDDTKYQEVRRLVRGQAWQDEFLAMSAKNREALAQQYRAESRSYTESRSAAIMDTNHDTVVAEMTRHGAKRLIHGHTHRPAIHSLELDGHAAERIVLGDWYQQASVLRCDAQGCRLSNLEQ